MFYYIATTFDRIDFFVSLNVFNTPQPRAKTTQRLFCGNKSNGQEIQEVEGSDGPVSGSSTDHERCPKDK